MPLPPHVGLPEYDGTLLGNFSSSSVRLQTGGGINLRVVRKAVDITSVSKRLGVEGARPLVKCGDGWAEGRPSSTKTNQHFGNYDSLKGLSFAASSIALTC